MKKMIITICVCVSLFLGGCFSIKAINQEDAIFKKQIIYPSYRQGFSGLDKVSLGGNTTVLGLKVYEPEKYGDISLIENCNQYFHLKDKGWQSKTTFDRTMESFFIKQCNALRFFEKADHSTYSYFEQPYFSKDSPKELPSDIGNIFQINRHPVCTNELNLELCLDASFINYNIDYFSFDDTSLSFDDGEEDYMKIEVIAKGDYNKDGTEDLLLFYSRGLYTGTYKSYGTFCLEKAKKMGPVQLLDCTDDALTKKND